MDWVRRRKKLFILLGMLLVFWFNHNQITNWHFHVKNNGMVVMHAHPYKAANIPDTPFQNHQHSNFEYLLLSLIFNTIPFLAAILVLGVLFKPLVRNILLPQARENIQTGYYRSFLVRGPPLFSY